MAIICNYKTQNGLGIENCYVKVESFQGDKTRALVEVQFKESQHGAVIFSKQFYFIPDLNSDNNIIQQAYDHLKDLPEFGDILDA